MIKILFLRIRRVNVIACFTFNSLCIMLVVLVHRVFAVMHDKRFEQYLLLLHNPGLKQARYQPSDLWITLFAISPF